MSFLVDTNILCERLKRSPSDRVVEWIARHESEIFVSVITIAEIRRGIERLPADSNRRNELQSWLGSVCQALRGNILSVNRAVAHVWGQMQAELDKQGVLLSTFDGLIAATAIRYDMPVVTRNVRNFKLAPVKVINPFDPELEEGSQPTY
ncbi:MAG: type II toxin-antitoxin system VapC family toxin [Verrucomicrobiales bacterium]|nr:type II toxin-antitoxin system VapC family toxin [Verrucomicrobiales bacterium]